MAANRQGSRNWATWLAAAWFCGLAFGNLCSLGTAQDRLEWKTGPALRQQLDASTSLTWGERPAREGLASLSAKTGVAIFLDRRLDPDRKLDLNLSEVSLQTVLSRIAERLSGGVSVVGPVVYLGPPETASKLASIAGVRRNQAGSLTNEAKARLLKSEPWQWPELSEPKLLLADLAKQAGVSVQNSEHLPHDLWPAADWPAIPWTDRLSLLLAGFGLSFELGEGGSAIRLIPMPDAVTFEKAYKPKGEPAKTAADLAKIVPAAKIIVEGGQLRVFATAEDHDKVATLLAGGKVKTTTTGPSQKRYSLTVENQAAGTVVKTVTNSLGKEMKFDPALAEKLQTKLTIVFKDVPLEELLDKTLKPLGLAYAIDETSLTITAAP